MALLCMKVCFSFHETKLLNDKKNENSNMKL
uniref:Uncharacterized protein n=1 Tax=Arundo donax TaxID=35708 RepID=A0A0A8ZAV1_ARUDO